MFFLRRAHTLGTTKTNRLQSWISSFGTNKYSWSGTVLNNHHGSSEDTDQQSAADWNSHKGWSKITDRDLKAEIGQYIDQFLAQVGGTAAGDSGDKEKDSLNSNSEGQNKLSENQQALLQKYKGLQTENSNLHKLMQSKWEIHDR